MDNVQTFLTHHQKYNHLYGLSISPEGALLSPASLTLCQLIISMIGDFIGSCLGRVGISHFDNAGAVRSLLQASITVCTSPENYIQAAGLFPQLKALVSLYPTHLKPDLIERIDKCMRMAVKKRWEGLSRKLCLRHTRCLIKKHNSLTARWADLTRRWVKRINIRDALPENNTAASKIQRAWKAHCRRIDDSGPVGDWLFKFHTDFVAHAIWPTNVKALLDLGEVQPAEMVLRRTGHLECEMGGCFGMRGEYFLPTIHLSEPLFEKIDALWPIHRWNLEQGRFLYKAGSFSKFDEIDKSILQMCPSSPKIYPRAIRIFIDTRMRNTVDKMLARDYETLLQAGYSQKTAYDMCNEARDFSIPSSKLNSEIRAGDNRIFWSYGDVIVLRGNARNIIACKLGCEVALLAPFQNHGEFFTLPLHHPETVILGPRAILEPYKGRFPIVYVEALTRRQRNFFRVPIKLDPEREKLERYRRKKP